MTSIDIAGNRGLRVGLVIVLFLVLVVATAVAVSGWGIDDAATSSNAADGAEGAGQARGYPSHIDYHGVRLDVPDGVFVQDVEGMVDGQMACPDVPVMLLAGIDASSIYHDVGCRQGREHRVIRIYGPLPPFAVPDGEVEAVNGFEFVRAGSGDWVHLVDPELRIGGPPELLGEILDSLRPSPPDEELSPPTTAEPRTEVTDRLTEQLACERSELLATYSRVGSRAGRQIEAPVSCYVGGFGYQIMVIRYQDTINRTAGYYESVYLIMDDSWMVTAMSEEAATYAHDRIGGTVRPPRRGCCSPPVSNSLPGDAFDHLRSRPSR